MSPANLPHLPADDRGFLLGDGLFETLRIYGGRPFRLDAHLARLAAGAEVVGIPFPPDVREQVDRLLDTAEVQEGRLRITLSRGSGGGLGPADGAAPTLLVNAERWSPDAAWYRDGLTARLAGRVDEGALTAGLKAIGYLERVQALRVARAAGASEALLSNTRGEVVEGSASNLLARLGDRWVSPGRESGALEGITRSEVTAILREEGAEVDERGLQVEEVLGADELILTSSLRELVPVVEVEGRAVGEGAPGAGYRRVHRAFRERVRGEMGAGGG